MKKLTSMKSQITALFYIGIMIPLLTALFFSAGFLTKRIENEISQAAKNNLSLVTSGINTYLDTMDRLSLAYVTYEEIETYFQYVNKVDLEDQKSDTRGIQLANKYKLVSQKLLLTAPDSIIGIGFTGKQNNNDQMVYVDLVSGMTVYDDVHFIDEHWYPDLTQSKYNIIFIGDYKHNSEYISAIRSVNDVYQNRTIGYIRINAAINAFGDIIADIDSNTSHGYIILDKYGDIVYSSNPDFIHFSSLLPVHSGTISNGTSEFRVYSAQLSTADWQVYYLYSRTEEYNRRLLSLVLIISIGIAIAVGTRIVFHLYFHKAYKPVREIIQTMETVERGNLDIRADAKACSTNEFLLIVSSLNRMIMELDEHIIKSYQAQIEQNKAEYRALQSQINPHFLYNILNIIITLNRLGEKQLIESSILQLTRIFRYTCDDKNETTIKEEFEFLEQYFLLQKLRYEELLEYQITCQHGLEDLVIPRLLVQPLVENAVIHGLEPSASPVSITLSCRLVKREDDNTYICIEVKNNGIPLDKKQLQEDGRIGLTNTEKRLHYFNRNAFMTVGGGKGMPTICCLYIPA